MILITTPTGAIGSRVLKHVVDAGQPARLLLRDTSKLPAELPANIEVKEGSHANADDIGPALEGVESVFWLPPGPPTAPGPHEAYVDFSKPFCDALPNSNVTHVVGVSALGREWSKPAGHVTASVAMDDMIGNTGVAYRSLSCSSLMENLLRQAGPIKATGTLYQPSPADVKLQHVAKADVAAVAARLLLTPDWSGVEDIPLWGPEDLTFNEIVEIMSESLGRTIEFGELSMDQFAEIATKNGASDGMVQSYREMLGAKNEGMDAMLLPASRHNTPTTFRGWFADVMKPVMQD